RTVRVLLDQPVQTIATEGHGVAWVMPDADAAGYYRWSLPPAMLQKLAGQASTALDPLERIAFIGNLSALLDAGAIHGDDYLKLLSPFASDAEPQVLSAVLRSLERVKVAFIPDESREMFARYVRSTLGPALDRFGLTGKPQEDEGVTVFRPQLIGWLGDQGGDAGVVGRARSLARSYMAAPASIDPSLAGVALRLAAMEGDQALFDEYRARFESARTPQERERYLGALGAFRDPKLAEEAIKYSLEG